VEAPSGSRHLSEWDEPPVNDEDKLYDVIETAVAIGEAHQVSAARVSLAWLLAKPGVTSLVVGARTTEQLRDNLAAADLELTTDELARLDEVSGEPLRYPYWHQAKTSADRLSPADLSLMARHLA
jgi:aryl-alcohol dehydrogenase-like predicted oxidoreductase